MRMSNVLTAITVISLSCGLNPVFAAKVGPASFDISQQSVSTALNEFARQSDLRILFTTEITDAKFTAGVKGRMEPEAALKALLKGTGLTYRVSRNNTILIDSGLAVSQTAAPQDIDQGTMIAEADASSSSTAEGSRENRQYSSATPLAENETSSTGISEIIVTAQKREERLRDVPMSVTAIVGDSLADKGLTRFEDLVGRVPGLSLTKYNDGSIVAQIRGLAPSGQTGGTVGFVVDDVPYGGSVNGGTVSVAPDIDPGDLARVEVLRGPQGTLYGASSLGGLIKYVTKNPSFEGSSGRVQAGVTSVAYGGVGYSVRGATNIPLSDTVAIRGSAFTLQDAGYVDNLSSGQKDVNSRDSAGGRVAVLWRPSADFSAKIGAVIQETTQDGPSLDDVSLGGKFQQRSLKDTGLFDRTSRTFSANLEGNLGSVKLASVSGYNIDDYFVRGDLGSTAAFLGAQAGAAPIQFTFKKFTQELRAAIPLGDKVQWLVGGFYNDEKFDLDFAYTEADPVTGGDIRPLLTIYQATTFKEYAAFTSVTADITDRFNIEFGGRSATNKQTFTTTRGGPFAAVFYGTELLLPKKSFDDDAFTYSLTPRYKFSTDFMAYARAASGYRSGGPNANCAGTIPCQYFADKTESYEIGAKGALFDNMLTFDFALYYIDWKDVQISVNDTVLPVVFIDNAGLARSDGVEFALALKPLSGLTISASGAVGAAELAEDLPPLSTTVGKNGERLPYSPRFSASISVEQEFPVVNDVRGSVGATLAYVGERLGNLVAAGAARDVLPSYTQLDIDVSFETGTNWLLQLYTRNLTNERGILGGGNDNLTPTIFGFIQPRLVGATITRRF